MNIELNNAKAFKKDVWHYDVTAITRMVVLSGNSLLSNFLHSELGQSCTKSQFDKACERYRTRVENKQKFEERMINQKLLEAAYRESLVGKWCVTNTNSGESFLLVGTNHKPRFVSYKQLAEEFGDAGGYATLNAGLYDTFKIEQVNSAIAHKIKSCNSVDYA
ncbi:hypothetical protein AN944_02307 [Shewanella sp. P1-14-1]|uniref:hypothetical protein n=1 Tax=Shewanella sp. P1-14-1 TaxID=1723761 RepID=UPI0006D65BF2|nr:hypothetical protein [Shewanella sp. P1-14-1]KPZ70235.1 hypothetical protein AN944_02307 [Shewanella sp. P1-14-1]